MPAVAREPGQGWAEGKDGINYLKCGLLLHRVISELVFYHCDKNTDQTNLEKETFYFIYSSTVLSVIEGDQVRN